MVIISIDRRKSDGALQIGIGDDKSGFRIAGAKYDGSSEILLEKTLTKHDAEEIMAYLKKVK